MPTYIDYICQYCKITFSRRKGYSSPNKYCSKICHARACIAGKNKNRHDRICLFCNKKYDVPLNALKRTKYCSKLCLNRANAFSLAKINGKNHPSFKNGIMLYRRFAYENFEKKCFNCFETKNLDVHHINGNREDNEIQNLLILCRKCHKEIHKPKRNEMGRFISSSFLL